MPPALPPPLALGIPDTERGAGSGRGPSLGPRRGAGVGLGPPPTRRGGGEGLCPIRRSSSLIKLMAKLAFSGSLRSRLRNPAAFKISIMTGVSCVTSMPPRGTAAAAGGATPPTTAWGTGPDAERGLTWGRRVCLSMRSVHTQRRHGVQRTHGCLLPSASLLSRAAKKCGDGVATTTTTTMGKGDRSPSRDRERN